MAGRWWVAFCLPCVFFSTISNYRRANIIWDQGSGKHFCSIDAAYTCPLDIISSAANTAPPQRGQPAPSVGLMVVLSSFTHSGLLCGDLTLAARYHTVSQSVSQISRQSAQSVAQPLRLTLRQKSDLKTCIAALNHDFFCLTFFTWWPEMTLTSIMVAKHSKWYLQMSETLSKPISWLCLCLTSSLVTRDPRGQQNLFSFDSFSRAFKCRLNF